MIYTSLTDWGEMGGGGVEEEGGGGGSSDNLQYAAHQLKCLERDIAFKGSSPFQRIKRTGLSTFSDLSEV